MLPVMDKTKNDSFKKKKKNPNEDKHLLPNEQQFTLFATLISVQQCCRAVI